MPNDIVGNLEELDAQLDELTDLVSDTANEIAAADTELDALEAKSADAERDDEADEESAASASTDEARSTEPATLVESARADSMDDKQAEAEIEAFLEAATDGAAPAEGPATQPVTTENAPTKQAGDKSKPKSTAAPRMRLWTLMAEAMLGVLEAVLVRLDGPVAKIRPEIKALIGYCAVVTLAMGIVAWTIALLR